MTQYGAMSHNGSETMQCHTPGAGGVQFEKKKNNFLAEFELNTSKIRAKIT
jgi:hypothetical protein